MGTYLSSAGKVKYLSALLENGGKTNEVFTETGMTVLCCAAQKGHIKCLKVLLQEGDVSLKVVNDAMVIAAANKNMSDAHLSCVTELKASTTGKEKLYCFRPS